ncbi:MAG: peptidoglycan-binding domain-containing protein [Gaiellaceae bacterium]
MTAPDNPDDWFAEPEADAEAWPRPRSPEGDDWLSVEGSVPRTSRVERLGTLSRARQIALGAGALVVLLLVLWGVGVFSGGGSSPPNLAPTTTQSPPTTTPSPPRASIPAPARTLAPGSSGAQVKRLQRALARLGYSPGHADGSYGPATIKALKRFQRKNGLQADGVLGPKTLRELKRLLVAS